MTEFAERARTGEVKVMLAEDDPMLAEATVELLEGDPTLDVVGCAPGAAEAIEMARETAPRVALVDVVMPGGGGPRATRELMKLRDPPRVLAISAAVERSSVIEMLSAGAVGYLIKGGPADELLAAIHRAARSESTLSPEAGDALIEHLLGTANRRDEEERKERIRGEVRALIDSENLTAVFQPILELASRRIVGCEALTRFPGSGRSTPDWFSDAANAGVGTDLDLAAIDTALEATEANRSAWPDGAFLTLNAAPPTLESRQFADLLDFVEPADLVFEITEHAAVDDYSALRRTLGRLRERGAKVAVDDAGAGYASLRHILRIDPEFIKLDGSLTRGIGRSKAGTAMAAALLSFAEKTGASVIAEGVETEAELATLVELGTPLAQGYLFGRPAPLGGGGGTASATSTSGAEAR